MKTSELKRILWEDCVESWSETDDVIYGVFWTVWKKERKLSVNGVIPLGVLKVLGEYHNTPPLEREERTFETTVSIEKLTEICNRLYDIEKFIKDDFKGNKIPSNYKNESVRYSNNSKEGE